MENNLRNNLNVLSVEIGERNILRKYKELKKAELFIVNKLQEYGYLVNRQEYEVDNCKVANIEAVLKGSSNCDEVIVIGAHYDSVLGTPGANDNGSGVVALLEIARLMMEYKPRKETRFVFFVNEEPPYFQGKDMGSFRYAQKCREKEDNIKSMICLETIGYYSDEHGSQQYPDLLASRYPDKGNFVAFVGNVESSDLVDDYVKFFEEEVGFPVESASLPDMIPGIGWSDHWSFWQFGYKAVMVTDTALFRYPYYHQPEDTIDKINFEKMAIVTYGLLSLIKKITGLDKVNYA